jgi:hypothetical protein
MSHNGIPVERSCGSYRPGHQVHWIQAKRASEKDQPVIDVSIAFREGLVYVEAGRSDGGHRRASATLCGGKWALWAVVAVY